MCYYFYTIRCQSAFPALHSSVNVFVNKLCEGACTAFLLLDRPFCVRGLTRKLLCCSCFSHAMCNQLGINAKKGKSQKLSWPNHFFVTIVSKVSCTHWTFHTYRLSPSYYTQNQFNRFPLNVTHGVKKALS